MSDDVKIKIKGVATQFTREQLEHVARTDPRSRVMEWEADANLAGKSLEPIRLARELVSIREKYVTLSRDGASDDEIRHALRPFYKDFSTYHPHLFSRLTDCTTTPQMLDGFKLMIAMRDKVNKSDISSDAAANIVSDYVSTFTVRDATKEELETGKITTRSSIKPYLEEEAKDPLNAAPGKKPKFIIKKEKEQKQDLNLNFKEDEIDLKEKEKEKVKVEFDSVLSKLLKRISDSESETQLRAALDLVSKCPVKLDVSALSKLFQKMRETKKWWDEECEREVDALLVFLITTPKK